jgi:NAD(P)-dependent dehydrogenase (short-subunit alcohol dehydrogenase family)
MKDRIALVTGAASGIGAEVCRQLASAGARVVLMDVDSAKGEALAGELAGHFIANNVSDRDSWFAAVARCIETVGVPDYAHLNAGVMSVPADQPFLAIEDLPLNNYRRILGVNLDGVVFGLQALIPHMKAPGGAITVTASIAGMIPLPIDPMYAASKAALIGLVRSVAAGLPDSNLRINAICPGGVNTAIVPEALRSEGMEMMPTRVLAGEVVDLLQQGASGEIRVRMRESEPAYAVPAPALT